VTDLEIDRALALAIGWKKAQMRTKEKKLWLRTHGVFSGFWSPFDYRDWNVIGPIAEKFDAFPIKNTNGTWTASVGGYGHATSDTPQKAVAMAVIGAKK